MPEALWHPRLQDLRRQLLTEGLVTLAELSLYSRTALTGSHVPKRLEPGWLGPPDRSADSPDGWSRTAIERPAMFSCTSSSLHRCGEAVLDRSCGGIPSLATGLMKQEQE